MLIRGTILGRADTCSRGEEGTVLLREEVGQGLRSEMEEKRQSLEEALELKSSSRVCQLKWQCS